MEYDTHRVRQGETLQSISQQYYGSDQLWQRIYQANAGKIQDMNSLNPGIVLHIPR